MKNLLDQSVRPTKQSHRAIRQNTDPVSLATSQSDQWRLTS